MFAQPHEGPPRRWPRRVFDTAFLTALLAILLVVWTGLFLPGYYLAERQATSVEIYHNTWRAVRDNIYDQSKLKDWASWEHRFDHLIKSDGDAVLYARQMLESLDDPYTGMLDPDETRASYDGFRGRFTGVGVEFEVALDVSSQVVTDPSGNVIPRRNTSGHPLVRNVLRGSPASLNGMLPGDAVVAIDGRDVAHLSVDELRQLLQGALGTPVTIELDRSGVRSSLTMVRQEVSLPVVSSAVLPGNVGYLRIEHWSQEDTVEQIQSALEDLKDCQSLVVDLRDNPGGLIHLVFQALPLFLEEGVIAVEHNRLPGSGYFTYRVELSPEWLYVSTSGVSLPLPRRQNLAAGRPMVLLVNEGTASASEIFAGALKDDGRAAVVGKTTFGKGIGQTYVPVGNGVRLRITNFRTFTPSGNWAGDAHRDRRGIKPDYDVDGRYDRRFVSKFDPQLDRALQLLSHP